MPEILLGIGAVAGLFWLLCALERHGSAVTLGVVLGAVVAESLLFENQGTSSGIFYLGVGSEHLRLAQVLIPLALLARLRVRGRTRPLTRTGILWGAFFAWYATCLVIGLLNGNDSTVALFEAKTIIYVGGGYALAAGVKAHTLVRRRTLARWVLPLSVLVLLLVPGTLADAPWGLDGGPLFDSSSLGMLTADATTILTVLGLVALAVELCRKKPRPLVAFACLPLLLAPVAGDQRASFVCLAVGVVALGAAMASRSGERRFATWRSRVAIAALFVAGAGVAGVALIVGTGGTDPVAEHLYVLNESPRKTASVGAA